MHPPGAATLMSVAGDLLNSTVLVRRSADAVSVDPDAMRMGGEVDLEFRMVLVCIAFVVTGTLVDWLFAASCGGLGSGSDPAARKSALTWLRVVVLYTCLLTAGQGWLGIRVGSVAIMSDTAHGGADVLAYSLSFIFERMKASAAEPLAVPLDAASAVVGTGFIFAASWPPLMEALQRLQAGAVEQRKHDFHLIGPALLLLAVVSVIGNLTVVALRPRARESAEGGARSTRRGNFLHMALHPGCACGEGHNSPHGNVVNLNMQATTLHLATDIMRGVCLLMTGVLSQLHAVADVGQADAVCAITVTAFCVLGSVPLLLAAASNAYFSWCNSQSAGTAPGEEEEIPTCLPCGEEEMPKQVGSASLRLEAIKVQAS